MGPVAKSDVEIPESGLTFQGKGLAWNGRWGSWSESAVKVLAACNGDVELVLETDPSMFAQNAADELVSEIQAELPQDATCVHALWDGPVGKRCRLRVVLACDAVVCSRLQGQWRCRSLCSGRATVSWLSFSDTASEAHLVQVKHRLKNMRGSGVVLEIPTHWVKRPQECSGSLLQSPGCHWFDFAEVFGTVSQAEIFFFGTIAKFVADFSSKDGAEAMFEALVDRSLYNPRRTTTDDVHPVMCSLGNYSELCEQFRPARRKRARSQPEPHPEPQPQGEPMVLRKSGGTSREIAPDIITVTPGKRVFIGREESCDVCLRRQHVSKIHAVLELRPDKCLVIRDTSANGTWVNSERLIPRKGTLLHPGDRVYFLPATHSFYKDALVYQVQVCERAGDIPSWLRSFSDFGEDLAKYEMLLLSLFDNVAQIGTLYSERPDDFFEDVVVPPHHRPTFAAAIRALASRPD